LSSSVYWARTRPFAFPRTLSPPPARLSSTAMLSEETRYQVMRLLEANPELSQRDVARELGISLGKVNYCVQALIRKGWVKAANFKNSHHKAAYMYLLTPRGLEEKGRLALQFLGIKIREYEKLRIEIDEIRREAEGQRPT
jgi:EPS-associated MarR family transcriptional regulator